MKSKLPYILIIALLAAGCNKDEDPSGAAGAVNKPFNLVVNGLESTTAYKLMVSPDGTKVLVGIDNDVNPAYHYSKDGGTTFTQVGEALNRNLRYASEISNNGIVLTSQNQVFQMEGGAAVTVSGANYVILGDKGKVFIYDHNSSTISHKNVGESTFQPIANPVTVNPGGGVVVKAPGKGVALVVPGIPRADKTVAVYLLDETTLTWSTHSAPLVWSNINGCNNLNQFERFAFGANNTLIMKGCTGMALMDLAAGTTKYVTYPVITNVVPESFRDGMTLMDKSGALYVNAQVFGEYFSRLYQYKDNKWEAFGDNQVGIATLALDMNGNIFYNSLKGEKAVIKSPVKLNIQSGARILLNLPRTKEQIVDAVAVGDEVMVISNSVLYRYNIAAGELKSVDLPNISHFNILSDGRWVAGGADEIYLSTDKGTSWTKTDKLFSPSLTPLQVGMAVTDTRIVNGQLLILGTSTYYYNNLTLGIRMTKHDNMLISLNGGKQNYQFPVDMYDGKIGPDGVLYGCAAFVSDIINTLDFYEIKTGATPTRLTLKQGPTPHIITDEGMQIALRGAFDGVGLQVYTRNNVSEEWKAVGEKLPNTATTNGVMKLRAGGSGLTFVNGPEVYAAGN